MNPRWRHRGRCRPFAATGKRRIGLSYIESVSFWLSRKRLDWNTICRSNMPGRRGMPEKFPSGLGLGITWLRCKSDWTKKRLTKALGYTDDSVLTKYERGDNALTRDMAEFLVSPLPHPPEALDVLAFAHDLIFPESPAEAPSPVSLTPEERRRAHRAAMAGGAAAVAAIDKEMAVRIELAKENATRQGAREYWERLMAAAPEDRLPAVACFPELRSWPLALLACEASVRAAARKVKDALDLAALAVAIAERVPGPESWRRRLEGYCWAHLGNSRRVAEDFAGANAAFAKAWELWRAGAEPNPGLLPEWRLLDLEASLRRDQRRFTEALDLLERARAAGEPSKSAVAQILLNKEFVFDQMGDTEGALKALTEAIPLVEASENRRLLFFLRFKQANNLCGLECYAEAAGPLAEARELAEAQMDELSLIRVLWLEARLVAGQGRPEEAILGLARVWQDFLDHDLPSDAALAALDLAVLWLKAGRLIKVRELAVTMESVFRAKGINREAFAALRLFLDAAKQESASIELAKQAISEINKRAAATRA